MPIFTFGFGHECKCGRPLGGHYVERPDRESMVDLFGIKWAHEYASREDAGVDRWALKEIVVPIDPLKCICGRGPSPDYALEPLTCHWCDVLIGAVVTKLGEPTCAASWWRGRSASSFGTAGRVVFSAHELDEQLTVDGVT